MLRDLSNESRDRFDFIMRDRQTIRPRLYVALLKTSNGILQFLHFDWLYH